MGVPLLHTQALAFQCLCLCLSTWSQIRIGRILRVYNLYAIIVSCSSVSLSNILSVHWTKYQSNVLALIWTNHHHNWYCSLLLLCFFVVSSKNSGIICIIEITTVRKSMINNKAPFLFENHAHRTSIMGDKQAIRNIIETLSFSSDSSSYNQHYSYNSYVWIYKARFDFFQVDPFCCQRY